MNIASWFALILLAYGLGLTTGLRWAKIPRKDPTPNPPAFPAFSIDRSYTHAEVKRAVADAYAQGRREPK